MKKYTFIIGLVVLSNAAHALPNFSIWNSNGNLVEEANCFATAAVYKNTYNTLPSGHINLFNKASRTYGSLINEYYSTADACGQGSARKTLFELQPCIIKKMGKGNDYIFAYETARITAGYTRLLSNNNIKRIDLEANLGVCHKE